MGQRSTNSINVCILPEEKGTTYLFVSLAQWSEPFIFYEETDPYLTLIRSGLGPALYQYASHGTSPDLKYFASVFVYKYKMHLNLFQIRNTHEFKGQLRLY